MKIDISYIQNCNLNLVHHRIFKYPIHITMTAPNIKTPERFLYHPNDFVYYDKRYVDDDDTSKLLICYTKWYVNDHTLCRGEKFKVVYVYPGPYAIDDNGNKTNRRIPMLDVWCTSGALLHIRLDNFKRKRFYDPYYRTIFGGMCARGNISWDSNDPEDRFIDECHKTWCEVMGRCFDKHHFMYNKFGGLGFFPLNPKWVIFEFFMEDNINLVKSNLLPLLDYNDHRLYAPPAGNCGYTDQLKREFVKLPYDYLYTPSMILPGRIRELPFDERRYGMLKSPGRPATGRKRKKLMYKLLPDE